MLSGLLSVAMNYERLHWTRVGTVGLAVVAMAATAAFAYDPSEKAARHVVAATVDEPDLGVDFITTGPTTPGKPEVVVPAIKTASIENAPVRRRMHLD